jgi:hypothetical protein
MNSITTLSLNTVFGGNDNSNLCPNCETMLNNFRNHNNISHLQACFKCKDKDGNTLLHNFVRCSLKDDKCKTLLKEILTKHNYENEIKNGINIQDSEGKTALFLAVEGGEDGIAELLEIQYNANKSIPTNSGAVIETEQQPDENNPNEFKPVEQEMNNDNNEVPQTLQSIFNRNTIEEHISITPSIFDKMDNLFNQNGGDNEFNSLSELINNIQSGGKSYSSKNYVRGTRALNLNTVSENDSFLSDSDNTIGGDLAELMESRSDLEHKKFENKLHSMLEMNEIVINDRTIEDSEQNMRVLKRFLYKKVKDENPSLNSREKMIILNKMEDEEIKETLSSISSFDDLISLDESLKEEHSKKQNERKNEKKVMESESLDSLEVTELKPKKKETKKKETKKKETKKKETKKKETKKKETKKSKETKKKTKK